MTLRGFADAFDISDLTETEKVAHIFYFLSKTQEMKSFALSDVNGWFVVLDFAIPNLTRLRLNLSTSRDFIRGEHSHSFKLHASSSKRLDSNYRDASFQQPDLPKTDIRQYISQVRIAELRSIKSSDFDLTKLIQICAELNEAHTTKSYLSIMMLTRALIDHVPPLFGANSFIQVASSYGGTKSFKDSMYHLENSSRKISDQHLHSQIRKKEVLPNFNQVDFSNDIDVLLSEIVRILK